MSTTKKLLVLLSSILCILAFTAGKTNAYEMNFGNTPAQVSPGESFVVEIAVSENTYLANGHITYDANLFTFEGVEQDNMSAAIYEKEGNISWMYTEISSTPIGETTFKFKFKAHEVTKTCSGDFTITGLKEEGAKFITTEDYTYSGTEVGGRKTQTVTIYVPEELIVSPSDMNLQVGESQNITVNKDGVTFESRDENIAIVDENGKVTGINPGVTIIKVTDQDGFTKDIIVTVTEATLVSEGDSLANKVLPQTGTQIAFTIILAIILVAILTFIFIRYKKYRKLFVMLPLLAILAIPNMVQAFTNVDTTKIKSGIFKELDGVSNVVAFSPNDSYKCGQNLVQADIDGEDGVFYGNNLGVQKVTDKNGNEVTNGNAIGTAYKVSAYTLGYENEVTDYNVVLYGDADGNTTICDNDDIDVIRKDYVYNKTATDVYKIAANLYSYDDILDVSDIQRMILKRFDNLDRLKGKDGTDGSSDTTLVNPFPDADSPIVLEPNKITLDLGDSESIKATGGTGELTWESREPEIATVDQKGNITGVSKGNTIITVTDEEGNTATVYVIVKNPATSVIVDPNTWITELDDHETKQLTYSLTPDTDPAPDAIITWSSSDEGIATVDENGLVTPVSVGEVEITVTATVPAEDTADGVERILTDVCKVVINQAASEQDSYVDPTDVTLNLNEEYNEKTQDLTIYLSPEYSNSTVEWTIEDGRDEVKFTDTTDVTAKTVTVEGVKVTSEDLKVTVTVTNKNESLPGFTKEVTVRVIKSASTIDDVVGKDPDDIDDPEKTDNAVDGTVYPIIDGTLILPNDSTYYMGVEYNPEDATSAVEWSSDKENIATVDSVDDVTGKITTSPDQQGYTNIKATTTDKGVESDPIKVYVAKIDLTGTDTVEEGLDIEDIVATVYPSDLRNNTIKWETADPNIATVDQNGKVHGVKQGTTTLTATLCASDESKTAVYATMTITVYPKLDITDEDGEKIEDGTEIITPVDSTRNWTINASADILNVEVIDNNNCIDNVNTTDGKISIESANTTGIATIKVSYKNGVTEVINVTVIVGKMTIAPEEDEIFQNVSTRINVESIAPSALAIKNETVKWSIDTENTEATDATIKATGRESAILTSGEKTGKVTIKAEYGDTGITATCEVIVKKELIITTGDSLLVPKDQTETIKSNYSSSELKFESEDPGIATVGANTGVVTGVKEGVTTVTVTAPDGQTKQVEVTVGSLQLTGENSVEVEQWVTIVSTIQPDSLKNNRVNWTSSNPTFATVNNGVVTGIAPGTVTITATMLDNNGNETKIKAEKTITVNPKLELDVEDTIILSVGGTKDITAGSGLNDSILSFTSDDDSVATVDSNGVITGKSAGTTKVTVKYKSGATSTITVRVIVGSISLTDTNVKVGSTTEIPRTILPSALQSYGVTWTSDNTGVAQVGASTGVVTGITPGTAKITAKIAGTDISDECIVTVYDEVNITADDILLATGEKGTVPYEYNGNTSDLQWSISPTSTATITNDGTITAGNSPATGTVTVKNKVTGQTDTANVIVGQITLAGASQVEVGLNTTVTPTLSPTAIQNYDVKWTSSDTGIATVNSGIVTGKTEGNVTITATVLDKNKNETNIKATKTITVNPKLELDIEDTIILKVGGTRDITSGSGLNDNILSFISDDTSIATVSTTGVVTGRAVGTTTVTVTYKTGETSKITVRVIVGSIELTDARVKIGNTAEISRTILPTVLQSYGVTWTSDNPSVATVGASTGLVTGKAVGIATITATITGTHISDTCTVTVYDEASTGLNGATVFVGRGQTLTIPIDYAGDIKKDLEISSNTYVSCNLTDDGIEITGNLVGSTTINITGENTDETINITVINFYLNSIPNLQVGGSTNVSATVSPTTIGEYGISYSKEGTYFTVDSNGLVKASSVGTNGSVIATLTKSNPLGIDSATVTSTRTVTVVASTTTIKGEKGEILTDEEIDTVKERGSIQLSAEGTSSSATFAWSSSDEKIATVDKNTGYVELISNGQVEITATDNRAGGDSAKVTINIIGVGINNDGNSIYSPGCVAGNINEITSKTLTTTLTPAVTGVISNYEWNSVDTNTATINGNGTSAVVEAGKVTSLDKEKEVKITVTATVPGSYGGTTSAETTVKVENDAVAQIVRTENSRQVITEYGTVRDAIQYARNNDTVQILRNITSNESERFYKNGAGAININNKTLTLDLNGHTVSPNITNAFTLSSTDLTIINNGTLSANDNVIKMYGDSNLTVNGGNLTSNYTVIDNSEGTGKITIYVDESVKNSIRITSYNSYTPTIITKGSVQIGTLEDKAVYADSTSPSLYIGGGMYAIEFNPTTNIEFNWYNGHLYGQTQSMMFNTSEDAQIYFNIRSEIDFKPEGIYFVSFTQPVTLQVTVENVKLIEENSYYNNVEGLYGDSNLDGSIDISDSTRVSSYYSGTSGFSVSQFLLSDLNQDGILDIQDVIIKNSFDVQIIDKLPTQTKFEYAYSNTAGWYALYLATTETIEDARAYGSVRKNIPIDINFSNMPGAKIAGLKIISGVGSITEENLVSGVDYTIENNYITFLKTGAELVEDYEMTGFRPRVILIIRYNNNEYEVQFANTTSILDYDNTTIINGNFDFSYGNYNVSINDYYLYKAKLDKEVTFNEIYSKDFEKVEQLYIAYMRGLGYSDDQMTNETLLYEFRRYMAAQAYAGE